MPGEIEDAFKPSRLRSLLEHFSRIEDPREAPKVRYPLREVLFLVVSATIADCEDYDEIALWGHNHLDFLRSFSEFYFGTPCADWLRVVMNRIDPDLFQACFTDWALALRPDAPKLIAVTVLTSIDGRSLAFDLKIPLELSDYALQMALLSQQAGLAGSVCSPQEAELLRRCCGDNWLLVCPGVRPHWSQTGDQRRVMTPGEAIAAGADFLVIGRPITQADDPGAAFQRLCDELG